MPLEAQAGMPVLLYGKGAGRRPAVQKAEAGLEVDMSDASRDGRRGFLKFGAGVAGCAFAPGGIFARGYAGAVRARRMGAESVGSEDPSYIGQEAGAAKDGGINIIGPKAGYSAQVGTLVSMLTWMQRAIDRSTKGLTQAELDHLFDAEANTIGALMLHLAATEFYYQMNTFDGKAWDSWSDEIKQKWDPAMKLGDAGRKTIKGHDRDYYLGILKETREKSLAEFAKRDDAWLMAVDKDWPWGPTDNYCKWFHVCEHISHHCGQIVFLWKRLPGKMGGE